MKKLQLTALLSLIVITIPSWVLAQTGEYYRYFNGEQITLEVVANRYMMVYDATVDRAALAPIQALDAEQLYRFEMSNKQYELFNAHNDQFKALVRQQTDELHISPVFLNEDGREQFASNEILVMLHEIDSEGIIARIEQEYNLIRIEDESTRWLGDLVNFRLSPPYTRSSLEIANELFESGTVALADVNWVFDIEFHSVTPNDQYFGNQWNIIQTMTDYAWNITTGSEGIIIAIVDEGVDLNHEDLDDNLLRDGSGNIIGINTTDTGPFNDPHPYSNDAHGTASAGIAAAIGNNSDGITGASWNSKIMPIQIARDPALDPIWWNPQWTYNDWIINGINFAANKGAHIISNSWGGIGMDQLVQNAFINAANGGAIIIASSGNYYPWNSNQTQIRHPAAISSVIAIGATRENDVRKELNDGSGEAWGSAYGSGLDLVAPGINIPTTDISGSSGYSNDNYILNFNGTSSSAPLVAGVAALMLSVNPNLTSSQVRTILQNTADWKSHMNSNEYGHGRLNAYEAVKHAMPKSNNHSFASTQTLSDALFISGSSTIASGATITVSEGTALIIDGTVNTPGTRSTIQVEGLLDIEDSAVLSNIRLTVADGGKVIIRSGASVNTNGGSIVVNSGGKLSANPNVTFDMNRSQLTVSGVANFSDGFTMQKGSFRLVNGGEATFLNPHLEIYEPQGGLARQHGFSSFGKLNLYGGVIEGEGNNYTWPGIYISGAGSMNSFVSGTEIRDAHHGVRILNATGITVESITVTDALFDAVYAEGSEMAIYNNIISESGRYGIHVDGGIIWSMDANQTIENNQHGLYIAGGAEVVSAGSTISCFNTGYGVYIKEGSSAFMNGPFLGNAAAFHTPDPGSYGNDITPQVRVRDSNTVLNAPNSWWGTGAISSPDNIAWVNMGGSFIWSQVATFNLWPSFDCDDGGGGGIGIGNRQLASNQVDQEWKSTERHNWYQTYVQDPSSAVHSLREMQQDLMNRNNDQPLWPLLTLLEVLIREQQFEEAETLGLSLLDSNLPVDIRWPAARRLFTMYVVGLGDEHGAQTMFAQLEQFEDPSAKDGSYMELMALFLGATGSAGRGEGQLATADENRAEPTMSNYPNPFNPTSQIEYILPENADVRIDVYNVVGQRVATLVNGSIPAGTHTVTFDGSRLASGLYLARMQLGSTVMVRNMMLVK